MLSLDFSVEELDLSSLLPDFSVEEEESSLSLSELAEEESSQARGVLLQTEVEKSVWIFKEEIVFFVLF